MSGAGSHAVTGCAHPHSQTSTARGHAEAGNRAAAEEEWGTGRRSERPSVRWSRDPRKTVPAARDRAGDRLQVDVEQQSPVGGLFQ